MLSFLLIVVLYNDYVLRIGGSLCRGGGGGGGGGVAGVMVKAAYLESLPWYSKTI